MFGIGTDWKSSLMRNEDAREWGEPTGPSAEAQAFIDKIAATDPMDWLFEEQHCHYAPGGRKSWSKTGFTFVYKPQALYLGPQDNMWSGSRAELPGGSRDLAHIAKAIDAVVLRKRKAEQEAVHRKLQEEQERQRANAARLLDQFTPETAPENYLGQSGRTYGPLVSRPPQSVAEAYDQAYQDYLTRSSLARLGRS